MSWHAIVSCEDTGEKTSLINLFDYCDSQYAVCPGGEGAVLKTVGLKGLAGSNPVCGAIYAYAQRII